MHKLWFLHNYNLNLNNDYKNDTIRRTLEMKTRIYTILEFYEVVCCLLFNDGICTTATVRDHRRR